jgi:transcription antitermination factor NusG
MPVLAREPDLFPEDLLEQFDAFPEAGRVWQVAHTLPRREKELARRLIRREIPFYLPLCEQRSRTPAGRRLTAWLPLFPGYLFVNAAEDQCTEVLETGCVARLLDAPDGRQLAFDLLQIHRLTESGAALVREPELQPGTPVRVTSGPFLGFEGRVVKRQSGDRLLILINYLQQGISISLEGCDIERT